MPAETIHDLPTPALLLDLDVLERNLAAMQDRVTRLGARLRPHVKTHKCLEIGRRQRALGARGITVATVAEALAFADGGFDDVTWAVPVPLSRLDDAIALARRITFRVLVDAGETVTALEAHARGAGLRVHVWLEVDCGYHRSGVDPSGSEAQALAHRISASPDLTFDGLLTHAGHGYGATDSSARAAIAREERETTVALAERLRAQGLGPVEVSVGSTPTLAAAESLEGVDEARPGNYAFHDWMQAAAGVCRASDVAVSVLTTVISHQPGRPHCIVDAGALAMSKDLGPARAELRRGLGPVHAGLTGGELEPRVSLVSVSQEHGFVAGASPADIEGRFHVGQRLRIMPNHSCLTAALFDAYCVVRGEKVLDRWKIWRGR